MSKIETHRNGNDHKEWVFMEHPDVAAPPSEVTLESFETTWSDKGWKIVSAPADVASNDDADSKAGNDEATAASHSRSRAKAKADANED